MKDYEKYTELNEEKLTQVVGGVLNDECRTWITENWDKIMEHSDELTGIVDPDLEFNYENFVDALENSKIHYDLDLLKAYLDMTMQRNQASHH